MKKMRLKSWVKKALIGILIITVLILIHIVENYNYNKAVKSCVAGGNDKQWCEVVLG